MAEGEQRAPGMTEQPRWRFAACIVLYQRTQVFDVPGNGERFITSASWPGFGDAKVVRKDPGEGASSPAAAGPPCRTNSLGLLSP